MAGLSGRSPVPTIEVRSWDYQERYHLPDSNQTPQYKPYRENYSPYYHSSHSSNDLRLAENNDDASEYLPVDADRPRRGFWSKIKRSTSDQARPNTLHSHHGSYSSHRSYGSISSQNSSRNSSSTDVSGSYKAPPQAMAAKPDVKLVWCPEKQIWLFPRDDSDSNSIYGYSNPSPTPSLYQSSELDNPRRTTKPKLATAAASLFRRRRYDEDQLLFAQLPGHYGMDFSDSSNAQQVSTATQPDSRSPTHSQFPEDPDNFDMMDRRSGQRSRWMNVAHKIGTPNPATG